MSLVRYAKSPQQEKIATLAAENPHWSARQIGDELGIYSGTVRKALSRMRKVQAKIDPQVHSDEAPPGYVLRGVSTLRKDQTGNQQWVKTERLRPEQDPELALRAFEEAVKNVGILPAVCTPPVKNAPEDLLTVIPLGDAHLGAITDSVVGGGDYDLETSIAELEQTVADLIQRSPAAGGCLIVNLGDLFHADSTAGVTQRSGHKLDVDPRWETVIRAGMQVQLSMIGMALQKHEQVLIANLRGNHDSHSAFFLQVLMEAYYRDEPRVTVVPCENNIMLHEHGQVLIAGTHGHAPKSEDLESVIAADYPEVWGRTRHRIAYTGHLHHMKVKEYRGLVVETCRVHGKRDRWSQESGYRAQRSIFAETYHKIRGPVSRQTIIL